MAKKSGDDEVYEVLKKIGLDDEEIENVEKRNKFLKMTIEDDMQEVINHLYKNCSLSSENIRHIIVSNPLILNESMERINLLEKIYKNIGFSAEEYKEYLVNFDKAFSLNPRELMESIEELSNKGKEKKEIRKIMIERPYDIL